MTDPTDPAVEAARKEQGALDALLADFQAKHPDAEVDQLNYPGGKMIVRTPDDASYAKFIADASDAGKRHAANVTLCKRSILWPETATLELLFKRKPGLAASIAGKLVEKAGLSEDVTLGK